MKKTVLIDNLIFNQLLYNKFKNFPSYSYNRMEKGLGTYTCGWSSGRLHLMFMSRPSRFFCLKCLN